MDENTNIPNDVNTQTDTSTDGGSSPAEQTSDAQTNENGLAQESGTTASETLADGSAREEKTVPFTRLQQEIEKRAAAEERARMFEQQRTQAQQPVQKEEPANPERLQAQQQLAQMMKEAGFVSRQEIEQQQAVSAVKSEHDRLAGKYNGKDGLPKYEPQAVTDYAIQLGMTTAKGLEIAYKQMHDAEIMNARIQKAMSQSRGVQTETSNGTGSANAGVSNDDLLKAANDGDQNATQLLIKRRLFKK